MWQIKIGRRVVKEFPTKEQCDTWLVEQKKVNYAGGKRWLQSIYSVKESKNGIKMGS